MLGWRLTISAVLVPALVGVFVLDHRAGASAPYLLALALLLALRAAWELVMLLRTRAMAPAFALTAACSLAVVAASWLHVLFTDRLAAAPPWATLGPVAAAYALSNLAAFLKSAIEYREPGRTMETLSAELLTISYVGVLLAVTAQLRWVAGAQAGYLVLGSVVVAAKCGDIGAYTLGRLFGKRKMVPRLSPGKTWMGGLGALLGSGLATWAWLHWGTPAFMGDDVPSPAWYVAVAYGCTLGVVGLVGDLAESLIKRDVGKKDAAALMPGFGGLLDLLDSVLYAAPVAYVLWLTLPLATWK